MVALDDGISAHLTFGDAAVPCPPAGAMLESSEKRLARWRRNGQSSDGSASEASGGGGGGGSGDDGLGWEGSRTMDGTGTAGRGLFGGGVGGGPYTRGFERAEDRCVSDEGPRGVEGVITSGRDGGGCVA